MLAPDNRLAGSGFLPARRKRTGPRCVFGIREGSRSETRISLIGGTIQQGFWENRERPDPFAGANHAHLNRTVRAMEPIVPILEKSSDFLFGFATNLACTYRG